MRIARVFGLSDVTNPNALREQNILHSKKMLTIGTQDKIRGDAVAEQSIRFYCVISPRIVANLIIFS